MHETINNIIMWADARNLLNGSSPQAQMLKLTEEVGELAHEVARGDDLIKLIDALGDCAVVLTILAAQYDLRLEHCTERAYQQIKDRKGKIIDGVFVKDAE